MILSDLAKYSMRGLSATAVLLVFRTDEMFFFKFGGLIPEST